MNINTEDNNNSKSTTHNDNGYQYINSQVTSLYFSMIFELEMLKLKMSYPMTIARVLCLEQCNLYNHVHESFLNHILTTKPTRKKQI